MFLGARRQPGQRTGNACARNSKPANNVIFIRCLHNQTGYGQIVPGVASETREMHMLLQDLTLLTDAREIQPRQKNAFEKYFSLASNIVISLVQFLTELILPT